MERLEPPHEPASVDEELTDRALAALLPGKPHRGTVRRWALKGTAVTLDDGKQARLALPYRIRGKTLVSTLAWYQAWSAELKRLHELSLASKEPHKAARSARRRSFEQANAPTKVEPAPILTRYGLNSDNGS